jgi:tetratricopeptide (TPR) repeat protein
MSELKAEVSREVLELLNEAAQERGSVLFGIPVPQGPRHPLGAFVERPVSWTLVEQHLIARHASEFALLLRSQWLLKLSSAGQASHRLLVTRDPDRPLVVPEAHDVKRGWEEWLQSRSPSPSFDRPPIDFDVIRLARLGLELEPSAARHVDLAASFLVTNDYPAAITTLELAKRCNPDHQIASCILINQGLIHSIKGESERALLAYRAAAEHCPDDLSALTSRLVLALECGSIAEATESGRRLNDLLPECSAYADEQVEYYRQLISAGHMTVDVRLSTMAGAVADRVGGAAGRISNVLA